MAGRPGWRDDGGMRERTGLTARRRAGRLQGRPPGRALGCGCPAAGAPSRGRRPAPASGPPPARDGHPGAPETGPGTLDRWPRGPRISGPLRRRREGRLAGGVATGLAARAGLDVRVVRAAFVISALLSGFGAAAYVVAWLLLPAEDATDGAIASRALADRRGIALAAGLVSVLVVIMLIGTALGAVWIGSLAWPGVITLAGLVLIWRNADPDEQASLRRVAEPAIDLAADYPRSRICGPGRDRRGAAGGRGGVPAGRAPAPGRPAAAGRADPGGRRDPAAARPLVGADRARPGDGAAGPDPGRGAGRHGRPGARLGAADARADPAPGRRSAAGGPAGPGPGAGAARLAVRRPVPRVAGRPGHDAGRRGTADPAGGRGPARYPGGGHHRG